MKITEPSTIRQTTQTALLTSQVAARQQVGEKETESINSLHLFQLSPDLNWYYELQCVYSFQNCITEFVVRSAQYMHCISL